MREYLPQRYLGLELAGAKNNKTALAALEYYPKEKKIFLLDIHERITPSEDQTGDEALLKKLQELRPGVELLGVNVPLELPPCISCTRKTCPLPDKCTDPAVKWMKQATRKAERSKGVTKVLEFTPYTQRPFEVWARYNVLPTLPLHSRFEIDEALGGNRAPLAARMHFLARHLQGMPTVEVWPKLSVAVLSAQLGVNKRVVSAYRKLEAGADARSEFLEILIREHSVFIYEGDLRRLAGSLTAFDAFLCAYTALLTGLERNEPNLKGFPRGSTWISFPQLR